MAQKTRAQLKIIYVTGATPGQSDFADVFDSFYSKLDDTLSVSWDNISGKPSFFSGTYGDLSGKPTLSLVAGSGSYTDLIDKPVLAAATGSAVDFVSDKRYGNVATPISANITASFAGAVAGSTICIVHQHSSAPTFPVEFIRVGTGTYDLTKKNFIWAIFTGDGSRVEYLITQEA